MEPKTTTTLGLFAHYRPVLLALPQGGCRAVASFLYACSPQELSERLEGAGLLYRHPHWGPAVSELLSVALDQPTLSGLPAELFRWNPEAAIVVEPLRLVMLQDSDGEYRELDLRLRSETALLSGRCGTPALMQRLRDQGNLWWSTDKGEPIDTREHGSMDPEDEQAWWTII